MCMGYAKEINAWVCDQTRSRREIMMDAWSRAFVESDDELELPLFEPAHALADRCAAGAILTTTQVA